jgi:hypothetical protein
VPVTTSSQLYQLMRGPARGSRPVRVVTAGVATGTQAGGRKRKQAPAMLINLRCPLTSVSTRNLRRQLFGKAPQVLYVRKPAETTH